MADNMEKKLTFRLLGDTSHLEKSFKNVDKESEGLSGTMKKLGTAVAAAFTIKAVVDFGKTVVEASANIQAMESQFKQVFKDDSAKAVETISTQVDKLGIHSDRLTGVWSQFGGQVKGAGMEGQQALDAVAKATMLSADASAFYDTALEQSSSSLASFMKGNFEAGDAIGVFTNAKQMDVRANELYNKSWADLNEAERQYLLLDTVEKTYEMNGAMGQASRESDAYANVMGNLKATMERFYSVVGQPILSAFLVVVNKVTEGIVGLTGNLQTMDWSKLSEGYESAKRYLEPFIEIAQNIGIQFQKLWNNVMVPFINDFKQMVKELYRENRDKIDLILGLFQAFADFLEYYIFPIFEGLFRVVKENFNNIKGTIQSALNVIAGIMKVFIGIFTADWTTLKEGVVQIWSGLWSGLYNIVAGAWGMLSGAFDVVSGAIKTWFDNLVADGTGWGGDLVRGIWNGISSLAGWLKDKVYGFAEGVGSTIKNFFGIASPSKLMTSYGQYIDEGLAKGIEASAGQPLNAMTKVAEGINGALGSITDTVNATTEAFRNMASAQTQSSIKAFDSLSSGAQSSRNSAYKEKESNFASTYDREIKAYSKMYDVDMGVAKDMLKKDMNVPQLATGGIVTKPTLAMIGEGSESEAVIPLSKLNAMVGGGASGLVVNIYGSVGVDDIGEQIVQTLRRKGVMSFA